MSSDLLPDAALFLAALFTSYLATSPPHKSTEKARKAAGEKGDWVRRIGLLRATVIFQWALFSWALFQLRIMFDPTQEAKLNDWISRGSRSSFRLGCLAMLAGGSLRLYCYHTLGHFFTFELAVQVDQKVIQTGPYAYVRHPSYTGILLVALGVAIAMGPYAPALSGQYRQPMLYLMCLALVLAISAAVLRINDEERMLKKELKEPYEDYCRKVSCRLIPLLL
ncbi:hypothetical protein FA10DRAFT_267041 [Acaromyces ingoldii]|uniref:Protein-S-isoprenylcysteine O-methyltransferase n=1 Tax=Acaromyces ingoldii TaxID=215250 RepID=A0A316YN05_9BASI|nr:hypothetical protein FA10DRAFT_267041 [Acaromyces ingoldii]PWN90591.1 hypothetical protein FA10DRAFT_267041 [Acaromyces ingoldii]